MAVRTTIFLDEVLADAHYNLNELIESVENMIAMYNKGYASHTQEQLVFMWQGLLLILNQFSDELMVLVNQSDVLTENQFCALIDEMLTRDVDRDLLISIKISPRLGQRSS